MSRTSYHTITKTTEGLYKEKGSKFIAVALPVTSEEEVKEQQEALRKKYYDARHHCYAYVIGDDYAQFRANDDGEPNHSAGDPILGQLRSKDLTNTLVVVIRYFGGTKLGVSGLIHAYKTAAEEALSENKIINVPITDIVEIIFDYESTNEVMRMVKDLDLTIADQKYEVDCSLTVKSRVDQTDILLKKLQLLKDTGSKVKFKILYSKN
jgi:uncharacterized YigZ family protein